MKNKLKFLLTSSLTLLLVTSSMFLQACGSQVDSSKDGTDGPDDSDATEAVTTTRKKLTVYPETIDFEDEETILDIFDVSDVVDGITTTVNKKGKSIIQKGNVNGVSFSFSIGLTKWAGYTTPEQMSICAKLFWYCYPQMYTRLANNGSPKTVALTFDNEGYEVASTSGNSVHIHDQWLYKNKTDYDCLTHEFAHVIQGGWNGGFSPSYGDDTYMIERFADYCRYVYAYNKGQYNDFCWDLQTARSENTYYKSVRFWVWIDYTYSTDSVDIMKRINKYVHDGGRTAASKNWGTDGPMWEKVFEGTGAAGKTITELWDLYVTTDFSTLLTVPRRAGSRSPLESNYNVRETVKGRISDASKYINL